MANVNDKKYFTQEELSYVDGLRSQAQAGKISWDAANKGAETIRNKYGYAGGSDGSGYTQTYGGSAFDNQYFSQNQLKQAANMRVESLLGNVSNDSAHSFVEQLRNGYGYSGGADGSQYIAAPKAGYQQQLEAMLAQLQNQQMPSYDGGSWDSISNKLAQAALNMKYEDWTKSDQYNSLASRYGQQGKMTMQDVLGQVSSRTGGLASSYATTASSQQYNDYMAKLEDAARQMYGVERSDLIENAQLAQSKGDSEYKRYLDSMDQYNTNRGYAFDLINSLMGNDRYQDETAYNRNQYETEYNDEAALNKAKTLAAAGDFSGYKALGYSDAEITTMKKAYDAEMAAAATKRSSSSGSGTGTGASKPTMTYAQAEKAYEDGNRSAGVLNALRYYYQDDTFGTESTSAPKSGGNNDPVSSKVSQLVAGVEKLISGNDTDYDATLRTIQSYMQQKISSGDIDEQTAAAALRKLGIEVEW